APAHVLPFDHAAAIVALSAGHAPDLRRQNSRAPGTQFAVLLRQAPAESPPGPTSGRSTRLFVVSRGLERLFGGLALADELGAELLGRRQVQLIPRGEDLLVVLGERDLHHRVVLARAQHDSDGGVLVLYALESVEVVHVHLHLTEVLMRELAELEIDEDEAPQESVVEDEVDEEVIAVDRE